MTKRIALIHAVAVAMAPIEEAFRKLWPQAERMNLFDDTLSVDRAKQPQLSEQLTRRICTLADYAVDAGADAVLFTCSAFGPAISAAAQRHACPVLRPNEAMFDAALCRGDRIGMIATFEQSVDSMRDEFAAQARDAGRTAARIDTICVPDAMAALRGGDAGRHNALVAAAAADLAGCDAIMLAQFSTSIAADAVRAAVAIPVLTSPDAAVAKLKSAMCGLE